MPELFYNDFDTNYYLGKRALRDGDLVEVQLGGGGWTTVTYKREENAEEGWSRAHFVLALVGATGHVTVGAELEPPVGARMRWPQGAAA